MRWETLDAHPGIRAPLPEGDRRVQRRQVAHHEQIRAFAILPSDLTIEDGSITPTLKVKRRILETRYHALIEGMYQAAGKSHVA